jgi:hypothetical protein
MVTSIYYGGSVYSVYLIFCIRQCTLESREHVHGNYKDGRHRLPTLSCGPFNVWFLSRLVLVRPQWPKLTPPPFSPVLWAVWASQPNQGHTFFPTTTEHLVPAFRLSPSPIIPIARSPAFYICPVHCSRGRPSTASHRPLLLGILFGTPLSTSTMAETAASPAPAPAADAQARPTRPDEKAFNEALAKADKDHKASMDQLVRPSVPAACQWLLLFPRNRVSHLPWAA